jgi:very-short-patch-repair endonuclease
VYRNQSQRNFARQVRNDATPMPPRLERRLWQFLRAEKLGVKFRRQATIGAYIVDFVCFPPNLIVELDGPQHVEDKVNTTQHEPPGWPRADFASFGFGIKCWMRIFTAWWRRLNGR